MTVRNGRFWLTPPELELEVRKLLGEQYWDPCPYPRPPGFDAMRIDWIKPWYCNPPFNRIDGGCSGFARKAVEQGGPGVFVTSIPTPVACLLSAGARFIDAQRFRWMEIETRKPMPSPGLTGVFYLKDGEKR